MFQQHTDILSALVIFVLVLLIISSTITMFPTSSIFKTILAQTLPTVHIVRDATSITTQSHISDLNRFYNPAQISVPSGTEVKWINDDNVVHTVTSGNPTSGPTGVFDSGNINPGAEFSWHFTSTSDYYCTLHPFMTGRVIVP